MRHEQVQSSRSTQALSPAELKADSVLAEARGFDLSHGAAGSHALPATHFLDAKARVLSGRLWPLIRGMPKGGALHVHTNSMVDVNWLVANVSYEPMLYFCGQAPSTSTGANGGMPPDRNIKFIFADPPPPPDSCPHAEEWRLLSTLREASGDAGAFDAALVRSMSLEGTPGVADMSLGQVWSEFEQCIAASHGMIQFDGYHTRYLQHGFEAFARDGISFVELRQVFQEGIGGNTYALDGTLLPWSRTVDNIATAAASAAAAGTGTFFGVKIITCAIRGTASHDIEQALQQARTLGRIIPRCVLSASHCMSSPHSVSASRTSVSARAPLLHCH
jgi:hypothetical protein